MDFEQVFKKLKNLKIIPLPLKLKFLNFLGLFYFEGFPYYPALVIASIDQFDLVSVINGQFQGA